jgi:hypothetical protein
MDDGVAINQALDLLTEVQRHFVHKHFELNLRGWWPD